MRRGISDFRGRIVVALVLGAVPALVLAASAAAAQPFPQIQRGHEISCSGPKAKVGVTVDWQKANRSGQHRGHAVALIIGQNGRIHSRRASSARLRSARSQSIEYRFRFPKPASRRLCRGNAEVDVVTSHGHNRDGAGRVEIHRVARRTLGATASASGSAGGVSTVGSDCRQGGTTALIKESAQLQECNLNGVALLDPDLDRADLTDALLRSSTPGSGHFVSADLTRADLTDAEVTGGDFTNATLDGTNFMNADLTLAFFTGATFTNATTLTGANCDGATGTDGISLQLTGSFVQC